MVLSVMYFSGAQCILWPSERESARNCPMHMHKKPATCCIVHSSKFVLQRARSSRIDQAMAMAWSLLEPDISFPLRALGSCDILGGIQRLVDGYLRYQERDCPLSFLERLLERLSAKSVAAKDRSRGWQLSAKGLYLLFFDSLTLILKKELAHIIA